jgi:hypothetical protein
MYLGELSIDWMFLAQAVVLFCVTVLICVGLSYPR